jgi:hypothetical protein
MSEACMRYPGWRVVAGCFAMTFFGFGFGFYGHSVYLAALTIRDGTDAPGIAVGTVSTAVTVYYLAAAAIMVFIPDLIARLGPRAFAAIGAVMMGLSLFLIARIRSVRRLSCHGTGLRHADECRGRQHRGAVVQQEAWARPVGCTHGRRCRWTGHCSHARVAEQQVVVCDRFGGHRGSHYSRSIDRDRALHSTSQFG